MYLPYISSMLPHLYFQHVLNIYIFVEILFRNIFLIQKYYIVLSRLYYMALILKSKL